MSQAAQVRCFFPPDAGLTPHPNPPPQGGREQSRPLLPRLLRSFVVGLLVALAGCGGGGPPRLATHPVEGRLFVNDQPAAGAQIGFHLQGEPLGVCPVATTAADGTFRLTTYAYGDGAPAGEYVVTVLWVNTSVPFDECGDLTVHDRLGGVYVNPAARRLLATVDPGPNALTLQAAVASKGWVLPRRN